MLCAAAIVGSAAGRPALQVRKEHSQIVQPPVQTPTTKRFVKRVKDYVRLRERLERTLPNLSDKAKPEEIEAHKKAFEDLVRKARATSKPGDILTPDIVRHIRSTIRTEFKGKDRKEIRETILEADTKGIPIKVNYAYPDAKELAEVPPTVLLKLPQLPKQVKYRFVRRHMLLVDRENDLIIDYTLNVLP
jgi:hypothetical protein